MDQNFLVFLDDMGIHLDLLNEVLRLDRLRQLDVAPHQDVLQNLDEQNLDVDRPLVGDRLEQDAHRGATDAALVDVVLVDVE